ncbi:putative disease resistance protein [Abeliophyllum distichum]|uniref:Disease resistance protein n=1 Tax=Abeliophyllum distichum TaxID=126358 RepID=A0ABD1R9H4_9LAMI
MDNCPSVESFPAGQFPTTLKRLQVSNCHILSSLAANLPSLRNLEYLEVSGCPNLECFPLGPWRSLSLRCIKIEDSENLKSLPDGFYNLTNLKELEIRFCPNLKSLPKQGLPPSLRSLSITECKNLSSPDGWKLHKLKSLKFLTLGGFLGFVSFSSDYLLPHSITELRLSHLPDLESLSEALQVLTSLERLMILQCENLKALPDSGLPATLSTLKIWNCPLLTPRCEKDRGEDWHKIADIPTLNITYWRTLVVLNSSFMLQNHVRLISHSGILYPLLFPAIGSNAEFILGIPASSDNWEISCDS